MIVKKMLLQKNIFGIKKKAFVTEKLLDQGFQYK